MRKVDKKTFMSLPEGTLFYKKIKEEEGIDYAMYFGDLCIKGENCGRDYYYTSFSDPYLSFNDNHNMDEIWINHLDIGDDVFADYYISDRDGLYEDDEEFFILDKRDFLSLMKSLEECLKVYK